MQLAENRSLKPGLVRSCLRIPFRVRTGSGSHGKAASVAPGGQNRSRHCGFYGNLAWFYTKTEAIFL